MSQKWSTLIKIGHDKRNTKKSDPTNGFSGGGVFTIQNKNTSQKKQKTHIQLQTLGNTREGEKRTKMININKNLQTSSPYAS